jgi:hypothetical protein
LTTRSSASFGTGLIAWREQLEERRERANQTDREERA